MEPVDSEVLRQTLKLPEVSGEGTWLQRMDRIADYLVAIGKSLMDWERLDPGERNATPPVTMPVMSWSPLWDLMEAAIGDDKALDYAKERAINLALSMPIRGYLKLWNNDIVKMYGEESKFLPYVLVSRAFFKACESLECSFSADSSHGFGLSLGAGGKIAGTGGEGIVGRNFSNHYAFPGKVQTVWVVLIDLADIVIRRLAPTQVIGIPEAIELLNNGLITKEQFNGYVRYANGVPDVWMDVALARSEKLQWRELIEYARRRGYSDQWINSALMDRGIGEPGQQNMMRELYWELPTTADFLHFLQRNVFDKDYVRDYHLMDGFEIRFWHEFGDALTAKGMKKEWAALHYAAHWIQPAPTQMQEFIYRLRPEKVGVDRAFTLTDYQRILAEQDYSPLSRQWFVDTAYRVPALGYIRDMYRQNRISDDDLVGYHQDLGYTHSDSQRFLETDKIEKARIRAARSSGWSPPIIGRAAALGILTEDQAVNLMGPLGWTKEETTDTIRAADVKLQAAIAVRARSRIVTSTIATVRAALDVGVMDVVGATAALKNLGWNDQFASGIASLESNAVQVKRVKRVVNQLRGAFHRGEIDANFVTTMLSSLGVVDGTIRSYLSLWNLERTPDRRRRTAAQIVRDIVDNGLPVPDATARLQRLGYNDADVRLFLADAKRQLITDGSALVAAEELRGTSRIKELLQLEKTSGGLNKRIVKEIKAQLPPERIRKWIAYGLMTVQEAERYMTLYGMEPRAIQLVIEEAEYDIDKKSTSPKPVSPTT